MFKWLARLTGRRLSDSELRELADKLVTENETLRASNDDLRKQIVHQHETLAKFTQVFNEVVDKVDSIQREYQRTDDENHDTEVLNEYAAQR